MLVKATDFDFSTAKTYRKTATLNVENVITAIVDTKVKTVLKNKEETVNVAFSGDKIVTGPLGERYVIFNDDFVKLYELNGNEYRSKLTRKAIKLTEDTEILAPWGETQSVSAGGYITQGDNVSDTYLIEEEVFLKTYQEI